MHIQSNLVVDILTDIHLPRTQTSPPVFYPPHGPLRFITSYSRFALYAKPREKQSAWGGDSYGSADQCRLTVSWAEVYNSFLWRSYRLTSCCFWLIEGPGPLKKGHTINTLLTWSVQSLQGNRLITSIYCPFRDKLLWYFYEPCNTVP